MLFGFSVSTEIKVLMGIPAQEHERLEILGLIFKLRNRTKLNKNADHEQFHIS